MYYKGHDDMGSSDETVDFFCTLCKRKGVCTKAINYCTKCRHYYCQTCTDAHNKDHGQHKMLKEVDFPFIGREVDPNERCLLHRMKELNMYCYDHDEIGCAICISLEHGSCPNVRDISDIEHLAITMDPLTTTERLKLATLKMNGIKTNREKTLKELSASRKHSIDTLKDFRKDLERVLERLEKASLQKIETESDAKEISVRNQLQKANDNVKLLGEALKGVTNADKLNSKQMFVSIKSAEKMLRSSELSEKALSTEPQPVKDRFQLNTNISRYLRGLRSFGDRHTFEIEQTSFQVQNSTDIDVKVPGETWSLIHDSCFTPDGFLLLSDMNNMIKRVHVDRECIIDYCNLPEKPYGICCTELDEAAVCLENNSVQLVSLGRKMTLSKQSKFKHTCYGVAYNDGELFISDHEQTVFIYNMRNKLLRKIHCKNMDSNKLISYDETTRRLYIAAGDSILTSDILGSSISMFTYSHVKNITSVCADGIGGVFLCCSVSNNVIRLEQYDGKLKEIVGSSDGIDNPLSVCFNRTDAKLCVTIPGTIIKIYDLKNPSFRIVGPIV